MELAEILKKVLKVDGVADALGEDGVKLLEDFEPDGGSMEEIDKLKKELKEAKGKAAGILDEKKKAQAKADELATRIEALENKGLTDVEKIQRELEREKVARETAERKLGEVTKEFETTRRGYSLKTIGSQISWLDSVPAYLRDLAIEKAFAEIQDLADEKAINETLEAFKETHKELIQASSAASGTGGRPSGQGEAGSHAKDPAKMTDAERAKQLTGR